MAAKSLPKATTPKQKPTPAHQQKIQSTLVPSNGNKRSPANNAWKGKPKPTPNGNIMAFFKKAEEQNSTLFLRERGTSSVLDECELDEEGVGWTDGVEDVTTMDSSEERYNESGISNKKRKVSDDIATIACSPPPPEVAEAPMPKAASPVNALPVTGQASKKAGPFLDDSESEAEDAEVRPIRRGTNATYKSPTISCTESTSPKKPYAAASSELIAPTTESRPPLLEAESTSLIGDVDFDEFEGLDDEELPEGEEYDERRWMEEQQRLEKAEADFEDATDDPDARLMFPADDFGSLEVKQEYDASPSCPICNTRLEGIGDQEVSMHVNACLDGNPLPLPKPKTPDKGNTTVKEGSPFTINSPKMFKKPIRPARSGQENPFKLGEATTQPKSAFSRLMAGHAEDAAWASAASSETAARGKPSYERTCPFYKIMPGFYICVDAFRYGAVKGQNAYFLSHFHSDHYVGLTKSWSHGPIFCSRVTANLVRQQLRVDPKWVVDLEFEEKTEVPGTEGVFVTMISANHCPGSSLFLFEKEVGKGKSPRLQRVLHCGDFRACQAHIEHPLLRPEVIDAVSGISKQQKLDACYLDTTYLTPKYAFPPQQSVIQACADMCVSLNKERADETDAWEQVKRNRAGKGMVKFVRKESEPKDDTPAGIDDDEEDVDAMKITKSGPTRKRGRLLVVVGTYSIGKERICIGIAKALGSKIYAPPNKQRICHALEDPELNALLTDDPRAAQVHMTPLFEIRAETLDDYLRDYRDCFSRTVGFRPSGWNYRPPKNRFTESPSVQTVLLSENWKSEFTMQDLNPQPGSTRRASCFGVPYSEHSSFRELTMFCCALRIDKIIPTVNVGSAKSREKMKAWCERWALDKKKNGLFRLGENGCAW